jgi:NADPH2:quinone reductase
VVGFANGEIPKLPWNLMLLKGASVVGVFWGDFQRKRAGGEHAAAMRQLLGWMAEGKLKPLVSALCAGGYGAGARTTWPRAR